MAPPNELHCRLRLTARRIATALLTCTLALAAIVAGAAPSSATTTWVPTSDLATSGVAYTPRAVFRSDRTAVVVWNTTSGAVKSSVLAEGSTTWAPLPDVVSSGAATNSLIPSVTVRSDDSVVTIWRTASGSLSSAVLAPGSASWTPLNDVTASAAVSPDSVYDVATGRTVAVWRTGVGAVESASLDNGSASWTPLGTLPYTSTNGGVVPTTLSANPLSGRVVAATMASGGVVKAASLPAGGSTWSALADVSSGGNSSTGPRVGSQPDDTTVVAFRGADGLVHTAKMAVGEPSWTSLASLATGGSGVSPWMALNPVSGAMILTWINSGVFSAAALEMGSSDWASLGTPTSSGAQLIPAVTVQPGTGRVLASWYTSTSQGKAALSTGPPGPPSPGSQPLADSATLDTIGISWTAAQDGGSPVSGYSVDIAPSPSGPWTASPIGCDAVGTGLSCIATGLSAGTSYYFRVNATNAAGAGPYSQVAGPFATANNAALVPILATPTGTADGFTTRVTNHDAAWTWGLTSDQGTATIDNAGLITVTGLTPGQTATITVTSTRTGYDTGTATGTGTATSPIPAAPLLSGTAGVGQAELTLVPGSGGSTPDSFTVTASPGGATCTVNNPTGGTCTVAGLTNGTAYTFTATAANTAGDSGPSNTVSLTPMGNQTISFPTLPDTAFTSTAPTPAATATSGLPITYASLTTGVCIITGETITFVVTGTCTIAANQAGDSTFNASAQATRSFTVIPGTALTPVIATPTSTADGFTVQVTNHDPAFTWGLTSDQGTATIDGTGLVTVTGLTPGQTATITVTSTRTNYDSGTAAGTGTAATVPGAPVNVTAAITGTTATITFDPAEANGSAITAYTVTANPDGVTCTPNPPFSPPLQCQIAGLTRGTAYTFAVTATNAIGTGPAGTSSPVNSADPLPDSAGQPWAALPDGANPPRRVGPGIAFPVLSEDDIETGTTLSSLTPGVCQVRDSRVFALRQGRCRIKLTTGTVATTRTIRVGGKPARTTGQVGLRLVASLYFRPNSATLTHKHKQQLARAARVIGEQDVIITGNAHDAGTGNADLQLSHRRATNTALQLEALGLDRITILTHAYGSIHNGNSPRTNRRVDVRTIG